MLLLGPPRGQEAPRGSCRNLSIHPKTKTYTIAPRRSSKNRDVHTQNQDVHGQTQTFIHQPRVHNRTYKPKCSHARQIVVHTLTKTFTRRTDTFTGKRRHLTTNQGVNNRTQTFTHEPRPLCSKPRRPHAKLRRSHANRDDHTQNQDVHMQKQDVYGQTDINDL